MPLCKLIHWISGDVNLDLLVSSIDDIVGLATASKQNSWCKLESISSLSPRKGRP